MDIQTIFPYNLVSQKSFMANFIKHTICLKHTLFIGKISITLGRVKVKIFKYKMEYSLDGPLPNCVWQLRSPAQMAATVQLPCY
jgi:hypothetical protein